MTITTIPTPARIRACVPWPELYALGNLTLLEKPAVSIVGTRAPSWQAKYLIREYSEALSVSGVCVVSGGAEGSDYVAELGALGSDGGVISVLPKGLGNGMMNPPPATFLYLSPFAHGTELSVANAMARVRLIVALASVVIAVEPNPDGSGATNETIRVARGMGRTCHVIPRVEEVADMAKSKLLF